MSPKGKSQELNPDRRRATKLRNWSTVPVDAVPARTPMAGQEILSVLKGMLGRDP